MSKGSLVAVSGLVAISATLKPTYVYYTDTMGRLLNSGVFFIVVTYHYMTGLFNNIIKYIDIYIARLHVWTRSASGRRQCSRSNSSVFRVYRASGPRREAATGSDGDRVARESDRHSRDHWLAVSATLHRWYHLLHC